jgi:anti-sigma factor RsiW
MEFEDLARRGTGMAGGRFGVAAARPVDEPEQKCSVYLHLTWISLIITK